MPQLHPHQHNQTMAATLFFFNFSLPLDFHENLAEPESPCGHRADDSTPIWQRRLWCHARVHLDLLRPGQFTYSQDAQLTATVAAGPSSWWLCCVVFREDPANKHKHSSPAFSAASHPSFILPTMAAGWWVTAHLDKSSRNLVLRQIEQSALAS